MSKRKTGFSIGAAAVIIAVWLLTGIYTVDSGEQAVVLRFGQHVQTVSRAGLNWHLPSPIEKVIKVNIQQVRRIEFGYKTVVEGSSTTYSQYVASPLDSRMFTADETIVNVETAIQYYIVDAVAYLFNVDDQIDTLDKAAESAIRRVVASHVLDDVLTENKLEIQLEIQADLQAICDSYGLGVQIAKVQLQDVNPPEEVDAAFKDVANAREDKNSYINEADAYSNEVLPKAKGNAAEMLNKAEAYKQKRIAEAQGDVAAFSAILAQYELGKYVTRVRMYIETMEEILPNMNKYIVDDDGSTLKFLPLDGSDAVEDVISTQP
jgi:modulator of FtsH protease HflK